MPKRIRNNETTSSTTTTTTTTTTAKSRRKSKRSKLLNDNEKNVLEHSTTNPLLPPPEVKEIDINSQEYYKVAKNVYHQQQRLDKILSSSNELFGFTINTEKLGLEITGKTTRDTEVFVSQVHSNSKCTGFIKKNDSFLLLNNIDIRQKTLVDVCRLLKNTKRPFTLYVSRKRKNTYLTRERMVSIDCFRSRTSQIAHVTKESIKINDEFYCYDVSAVRLINKNNDEKDTSEEGSNILEPFGFLYKCTVLQTTLKSKSQKGGTSSNNNVTDDSDEDNQVKVHFHNWSKRYDSWVNIARLLPDKEEVKHLANYLLQLPNFELEGFNLEKEKERKRQQVEKEIKLKQEQLRKQKEEKRKLQLETENKYFNSVREKMNSLKAKIYHCTSEDGRVLFYKSQRIVGDKTTRVNKFGETKLLYQNFYTNYTDEQKVVARNTLTKLLVTHNTLLSTNFYTE